jgi:hypothetical protein
LRAAVWFGFAKSLGIKRVFFEEKKPKTFAPGGFGDHVATGPRTKVFLLLFLQKKKRLLAFNFAARAR